MPLIASSDNAGSSFQLAPAGSFVARCIAVTDLGTQHDEFQGKPKIARRVRIGFELPTEKAVFDEEKGEEPFFVGKEYTLSLDPKANLRKDLEAWRGRAFSDEEAKRFDLEKLLGVPVLITIQHGKTQAGKNYAKIAGLGPLPKQMPCPPQINASTFYSLDMGNCEAFRALPTWIKEKIEASDEWKNDSGPAHEEHHEEEAAGSTTTPF